jgi:glutamate N-acetyltransferase / amino-acid N-acetyltransferase
MSALPPLRRLLSTFTAKPAPDKTHLHAVLPDAAFPRGFLATGLHCGVKKKAGVPDLGVLVSTAARAPAAAACFTRNAFQAAPVAVSADVLARRGGRARALVVNSGCANAVTGRQGVADAWAMARATDGLVRDGGWIADADAEGSNSSEEGSETLVMSTGVIGQTLPIAKILGGIAAAPATLGAGFAAWERLARAFMTTDTFPKLRARAFALGGREYRMAGIDKGAGMIHPDMGPPQSGSGTSGSKGLHATLLGCIATDAAVSPRSLQSALAHAVDRSFNSISVDGDMSTNDTVVALANGAAHADAPVIDEEHHPELYAAFRAELTSFAAELAQLVVRDGEGATKFVTVTVEVRARACGSHSR